MKIMGITAGRPGGNSEILLKEALMAVEENFNAETIWVNLHDANIIPCTGCEACMTQMMMKQKKPVCIHRGKDDMEKIMEEMASADGLIISVPSFCLAPQGIWKVFTDRWLPYEWAIQKKMGLVERVPERVAGLIACGGATQNWQPFSLALLNVPMFMQSIKVVDMIMATGVARPGQVLLKPEFVNQAHNLGINVGKSCKENYEDVKYLGERKGWCPVCHHNLLIKGEPHWNGVSFKIECGMCGAGGNLVKDEKGEYEFIIAPNGLEHCRIFTEGRENHAEELGVLNREFFSKIEEIKGESLKYKNYKPNYLFDCKE